MTFFIDFKIRIYYVLIMLLKLEYFTFLCVYYLKKIHLYHNIKFIENIQFFICIFNELYISLSR